MPMLHRRRLARELHQLRVRSGLTCAELAQRMDCSASKINRMETGNFPIAPRDARELARIYGLAAEHQDQLVELARVSRRKGWWDAYSDILPAGRIRYLGLESAATQIRIYDVGVLPGLLQAPAYARAVAEAGMPGAPVAEAARLARMQRSRQSVLTGAHPAAVAVVVDEAAIRRQVGGPEVMRSQLRHLLAAPPNMAVQVLPFSAGAGPSIGRPFVLLSFSNPADDDLAYVRDHETSTCIDEADMTGRYLQFFDRLSQMALAPDSSAALVSSILDEL
jgi:transcriptional regulator with XRE-family HTH domain